jgi:hypothetical protein
MNSVRAVSFFVFPFSAYAASAVTVHLNQYSSICTGWRTMSESTSDSESMDHVGFVPFLRECSRGKRIVYYLLVGVVYMGSAQHWDAARRRQSIKLRITCNT